jgi:PAS domain S-box-containing protein
VPIFGLLIWMQQRLRGEWRVAQSERLRATSAQAQYHLLLQTTDQGIFGLDAGGRCTFVNRAAADMLGYATHELLGQPLHARLYHGDGSICAEDRCPMQLVMVKEQRYRLVEYLLWRKNGVSLEVEASAFHLDNSDIDTKFVVTFMDTLERKQRTQALLQYQRQLQSLASQLRKTEEQVRHRLATDLHDNLAQILALCRMKLGSLQRTVPESVKASLTSVVDLINDALRYTRELMSDLRPPILGDERDLGAAVQWVTEKLQRYGLTVTVIDDHRPKPLEPDVLRIVYQSLHELLFNVLKHTQTTAATVVLRRFGKYLVMEVRDRGTGFREGAQKAPTREGGFGLFNMREQIASVGGRMKIASTAAAGSRVTIVLPLEVAPSPVQASSDSARGGEPAHRHLPDQQARIRILLVDDHQIMREGLRTMIEGENDCEVVAEAGDGQMAIELAATLRPDIIVMDINMPKVNGLEATRRIKRMMPEVAIIGLSVQEDPALEQLMFEAGASAYLSKGTAFHLVCDTIRQIYFKQQQHA